jgi:hypothetical protein
MFVKIIFMTMISSVRVIIGIMGMFVLNMVRRAIEGKLLLLFFLVDLLPTLTLTYLLMLLDIHQEELFSTLLDPKYYETPLIGAAFVAKFSHHPLLEEVLANF